MYTPTSRLTLTVFALVLLSSSAAPASAQRFSDWSAPTNLGPTVNTSFTDG